MFQRRIRLKELSGFSIQRYGQYLLNRSFFIKRSSEQRVDLPENEQSSMECRRIDSPIFDLTMSNTKPAVSFISSSNIEDLPSTCKTLTYNQFLNRVEGCTPEQDNYAVISSFHEGADGEQFIRTDTPVTGLLIDVEKSIICLVEPA